MPSDAWPEHDAGREGDAGRMRDGAVAPSDAAVPLPDGATPDGAAPIDAAPVTTRWQPTPGTSWQWQLSGTLDTSIDVDMYDIDLFGTSDSEIAALKARGRRVVCYFDTAYEPYRPDERRLRPYRGNAIEGWPDQSWLDIRRPEVLAVMKERLALAAKKGCDGVEADDVDVASNDSGFPLTKRDQQTFIRTLAREAHALGLAYGLKNALEDVTALLPEVDFAVNEECFTYDECALLEPFIAAGKAVFQVEYPSGASESLEARARSVCPRANAMNFDALIKQLDLDEKRVACR